jgi:heterotetrameric sarcosine oxidase gamma subunit
MNTLHPRSLFADVHVRSTPGTGVVVTQRDGLSMALLASRKGRLEALASQAQELFGVELPRTPRRAGANGLTFIGLGVGRWLVLSKPARNTVARSGASVGDIAATLVDSLRERLGELATVSDQSGSYAILHLSGPHVRDALAKCVLLDLHARVFVPGSAASTIASHIPVTLWRLDDSPTGSPQFEIAAPRSYAGSFSQLIAESAAELGITWLR